MWRADDVSFVESLPRLFVMGKTGLVVDTVQGAPHNITTWITKHIQMLTWMIKKGITDHEPSKK